MNAFDMYLYCIGMQAAIKHNMFHLSHSTLLMEGNYLEKMLQYLSEGIAQKVLKCVSHHSAIRRVPLPPLHHPEGAGAQLLCQNQLAVLDQTGKSPANFLNRTGPTPLLPSILNSRAGNLYVSLKE